MATALAQKAHYFLWLIGSPAEEKTLKAAKVKRNSRLRFMLRCYLSKQR